MAGRAGAPATHAGDAERARLAEEHLLLVEDHLAAEIAAGRPAAALGRAAGDDRRPSHCASGSGGCDDGALPVWAAGRCRRGLPGGARHLRDEVGMEPGPQLRALAEGVLRHTLPRTAPPGPAARSAAPFDGPHYADADGRHVAWGAYGTGPADVLLLNPTFLPIDAYREEAHLADAIRRLAKGRRVLAFDRSGLGLSDPVAPDAPPSVAQWARDAVAVLDASGAGRVHVLANADTGMIALQLAAEHPDRVASVTAVNPYARATVGDGYPHGEPASFKDVLRGIRTPGVRPPVDVLTWIAPAVADDARFRAWWDAAGRRGASPRTAGLVHHAIVEGDVRALLPRSARRCCCSRASTAPRTTPVTAAGSPPTSPTPPWRSTPTRTACGSSATSSGCSRGSPPSSRQPLRASSGWAAGPRDTACPTGRPAPSWAARPSPGRRRWCRPCIDEINFVPRPTRRGSDEAPARIWGRGGVSHPAAGHEFRLAVRHVFGDVSQKPWVIQRFLPEVKHGDKRIILVDGEFAGAVNRVPGGGRPALQHGARWSRMLERRSSAYWFWLTTQANSP